MKTNKTAAAAAGGGGGAAGEKPRVTYQVDLPPEGSEKRMFRDEWEHQRFHRFRYESYYDRKRMKEQKRRRHQRRIREELTGVEGNKGLRYEGKRGWGGLSYT